MSFYFFEGLSFGFGDEDVTKDTTEQSEAGIDPEQSVEADGEVDGGEELEDEKGHGQVEAGDGGAQMISHASYR